MEVTVVDASRLTPELAFLLDKLGVGSAKVRTLRCVAAAAVIAPRCCCHRTPLLLTCTGETTLVARRLKSYHHRSRQGTSCAPATTACTCGKTARAGRVSSKLGPSTCSTCPTQVNTPKWTRCVSWTSTCRRVASEAALASACSTQCSRCVVQTPYRLSAQSYMHWPLTTLPACSISTE